MYLSLPLSIYIYIYTHTLCIYIYIHTHKRIYPARPPQDLNFNANVFQTAVNTVLDRQNECDGSLRDCWLFFRASSSFLVLCRYLLFRGCLKMGLTNNISERVVVC